MKALSESALVEAWKNALDRRKAQVWTPFDELVIHEYARRGAPITNREGTGSEH